MSLAFASGILGSVSACSKTIAVLATLRTDCRQHARTRFSSVLQCLLLRRRKGLVGCDQLLAFGGRIIGEDRWAGLAVVVIPQNASRAHLVSTFRIQEASSGRFKDGARAIRGRPARRWGVFLRVHALRHDIPPMGFEHAPTTRGCNEAKSERPRERRVRESMMPADGNRAASSDTLGFRQIPQGSSFHRVCHAYDVVA